MRLDLTRCYVNRNEKMRELTPHMVHISKLDLMAMILLLVGLMFLIGYELIGYLMYVFTHAVRVQ